MDLLARKLKIESHVRIPRTNLFGLAPRGYGTSHLSRLEPRIAQIEVERLRTDPALSHFLIRRRRLAEFALIIKFVGGVEICHRFIGPDPAGKKRKSQH